MNKSLQQLLSLKDKTAVVTGGAGYLGTAISEREPDNKLRAHRPGVALYMCHCGLGRTRSMAGSQTPT